MADVITASAAMIKASAINKAYARITSDEKWADIECCVAGQDKPVTYKWLTKDIYSGLGCKL